MPETKSSVASDSSNHRLGRSMLANFCGIFGSRIFGLLREICFAWYWGGTGACQAAFHLGFQIPNTFRGLFGEGAFTAAFVPEMTGRLATGSRDHAWKLAERVITLQGLVLAGLLFIIALGSWSCSLFLPDTVRLHIKLTFRVLPLLLPYALLICIAGAFGAILNCLRKFALPSANPILFNLVQIIAMLLLWRLWPNTDPAALYFFCLSILLAGLLQLIVLMLACRKNGFIFHFTPVWKDPGVQAVIRRFIPATIGAGAFQLNQWIDCLLVGTLGATEVAALNFSQRLMLLPVGLFGVAIGMVCLQALSKAIARGEWKTAAAQLDFSLRQVLFLSLPCAVILAFLAAPFIRLLFHHGAFNEEAVSACVYALLCYLPGVPAYCLLKVATNPHHAMKDTRTPVVVTLWCILLNFVLNLLLMVPLRQGGLALATVISSWVHCIVLLHLVRGRLPAWNIAGTIRSGGKILLASLIGGGIAWGTQHWMPCPTGWEGTLRHLYTVVVCGSLGGIGYLLSCFLLGVREASELLSSLRRS